MMTFRRAVFLDRDGVLNRAVVRNGKPYPPASVDAVEVMPGAAEALARLKRAGFLLLVVTNQPDVARGTQTREAVEAINARLCAELPLDDVFVCYEDGNSPRKKPHPGLLLEAAHKHNVDRGNSFMVGDRWKDIAAGQRAGCRTVFLDHGYAEERHGFTADFTTTDLAAVADWILTAGESPWRVGA